MAHRIFSTCGLLARLSMVEQGASLHLQRRFTQTLPPEVWSSTDNASLLSMLQPHADAVREVEAAETPTRLGVDNTSSLVAGEGALGAENSTFWGGVGSEQILQAYSNNEFPFKLYGEDPRASVTDDNRVFSSTSSSSYDPATFCTGGSMMRDVQSGIGEQAEAPQLPQTDLHREEDATATVAAVAALAIAADVKKAPDNTHSIFFHPPPLHSLPLKSQKQQTRKQPHGGTDLSALQSTSLDGGVVTEGQRQAASGVENGGVGVEENGEMEDQQQRSVRVNNVGGHVREGDGARMHVRSPAGSQEGGLRVVVRDHMRNCIDVDRLSSFADLVDRLPPWLQKGLAREGYRSPTLVQSVAIPLFMEKRDVVGIAPTGSGKTVAFTLPALAGLAAPRSSGGERNENHGGSIPDTSSGALVEPRVLVLCPTRELVQQTRRVFSNLATNAVRVKGAFGGQDREQQLDYLRRQGGCDVLVATPGRLCDFVEVNMVSLKMIDFLIMDEADRMLELGFAPQLEFVMSNVKMHKRPRQTTMWTATWNATVGSLATRFLLPERVVVEVDSQHKINADITQKLYAIQDASQRLRAVVQLYNDGVITKRQQVLIFANRKEVVEQISEDLRKALQAPPGLLQFLHGGMKQRKREAVLNSFKEGAIRILCASDIAARGLDVPALDHVINYELPGDTDAYVHRIGRTGRAGRQGTAHTLIHRGDIHAPLIARFVAAQTGADLPDDVLAIVREVELHGGGSSTIRNKYKSHARVSGRDWRVPGAVTPTSAQSSRFVRGVGHVVTLKRSTNSSWE